MPRSVFVDEDGKVISFMGSVLKAFPIYGVEWADDVSTTMSREDLNSNNID